MKRKLGNLIMMAAVALICLLLLPTEAKAASVSDLTFELQWDGTKYAYAVTDCNSSAEGELIIPSTYNGRAVTAIGNYAFDSCGYLTKVTIPDSVLTIGDYAFYLCQRMTTVTISNSITSIGHCAFEWCYVLTSVTIPSNVTTIGERAFAVCAGLRSIWVAEDNPNFSSDNYGVLFNKDKTVLIQAPCAISGSYSIPDSVTSISKWAFNYCKGLTTVTIPNSVTSIGYAAFDNSTGLTDVYYNGAEVQWNAVSIEDINKPLLNATIHFTEDMTVTPEQWAERFLSLQLNEDGKSYCVESCGYSVGGELIIPATYNSLPVTSIADEAFWGCRKMTHIVIPNTITYIGNQAFDDCTGLTCVTIGNNVKSIGEYAFYNCINLTAVTIPDSIKEIGRSAFHSCSGLTSVYIGKNVSNIGESAFYECSNLTSITIPSSITSISRWAFCGCDSLTAVTISQSVTSICLSAFAQCTSLSDVYYTGTQEQWDAIAIDSNNDPLLNATLHLPDPCADGHTFGEDAVCDNCGYTKLTADAVTLDAANKLTVTDEETTNGHHRATVYFLGEQSVADIYDEAALKAIDANAKTHWGLASINKVQLKDNGNYVVHIHYNEGTGAKQTVAKAFTVNIVKPVIEMNGHKVMVTAGDSSCINYRATVYYLGEKAVNNITDEAALKANAESAKTYWGLTDINKVQLLNNGNYVILLHYNIGTGAKQTVAKTVTVDRSEPTLNVANGKIVASDPNNAFLHHRAVVYYLGEGTSIEDAVSTKTYWTLSTINKVNLTQPGNYVILLHYNLADSVKMTVTAQVTI